MPNKIQTAVLTGLFAGLVACGADAPDAHKAAADAAHKVDAAKASAKDAAKEASKAAVQSNMSSVQQDQPVTQPFRVP